MWSADHRGSPFQHLRPGGVQAQVPDCPCLCGTDQWFRGRFVSAGARSGCDVNESLLRSKTRRWTAVPGQTRAWRAGKHFLTAPERSSSLGATRRILRSRVEYRLLLLCLMVNATASNGRERDRSAVDLKDI